MLSTEELKRYNRHIILEEVGKAGQEKLKMAKVLVIGTGGLGCPVLQYLTAAGVGTIGIVDFDVVDHSNLQRQILFDVNDIGHPKAEVARKKLSAQNPFVQFNVHQEKLTSSNALALFEQYDIVVDGSDNFPTRYLTNDACVITGKPLVFGSIFKFDGQVAVFNYNDGPTYRCLFPAPPDPGSVPNCAQIGVIGVLPGLIGTIQANEVIKLITGIGEPLSGKLLIMDALTMETNLFAVARNANNAQITELIDYEDFCGLNTPFHETMQEMTSQELAERLEQGDDIQLLDVREPFEYEICHLDAELMPLSTISNRVADIPRNVPVVVYCHHGMRSAAAITTLQQEYGFNNLYNLIGGIHDWAANIDPEMEQY